MTDQAPDTGAYGSKPNSARRSPQDKKRLSYDKDRRNTFGESDKAARKAIPLHKRLVNRANRHQDRQTLLRSTGVRRPDTEDATDDHLHRRRRKRWRKTPDETLRETVKRKLARRQAPR